MDALKLLDLIGKGETSTVQFKMRLDKHDRDGVTDEMVAMSNSKGGIIIFGVDDKTGETRNMDYTELMKTEQALSSLASDNVKPEIYITTEHVSVSDNTLLVVTVQEGYSKPYKNTNGTIYVKQGADKRKVTSNAEIMRLFQSGGMLHTDEMAVVNTSIDDLDMQKVYEYVKKISPNMPIEEITPTILSNIGIMKDDNLTLSGLLFFARSPQNYKPLFMTKAVAYYGNDRGGTDYRDSEDITGTIPEMYDKTMAFIKRNLHHVQDGQNFNSVGHLEISEEALTETLQNAYMHRDYTRNASILVLYFRQQIRDYKSGQTA